MSRVLVPLHIDHRPPPLGWAIHALAGQTMGTTWSVKLAGPRGADTVVWQAQVQGLLDEVVAQMSHWDHDSVLGRFNASPAGSVHPLPDLFFDVLRYGLQVARDSGGAFDPAAGALVNAWGFGPGSLYQSSDFEPPGDEALARLQACSGWHRLHLDEARRCVTQPGGLVLDFSSIAKGFAVDHVMRWFQAQGLPHVLVEVGGELRGAGIKPDGQPWWVTLEQPIDDQDGQAQASSKAGHDELLIALHGLSVATSGDYRRFFMRHGQRMAHTLDPRTGRPVQHGLASVTVIHADCMAADALSTALLVMGVDQAMPWATSRGLAARLVHRRPGNGLSEHLTPAWQLLLG